MFLPSFSVTVSCQSSLILKLALLSTYYYQTGLDMAEAFGVAAGAIGVVSLGIQLAESLQKVKSFCASVKNAPLHIAELIEEIEIMRDILSDLESGCLSANVASSSNMHRCLKIAQRATIGLVSFSNELQARIKKSRFRGGARFALSRDEIKQMLNQLERTKSSLILAYSIYREAIADDRHSVMLQATSRGQESPARKSPAVSLLVQASASSAYNKSTFAPHKLMVGKTLFQVTTPRWMSDTIWQLEMRSSFSGLNVFTRSYGIVPSDAPIFEACKVGDDSEIQRLLDSGLASPFDEDQWGCSLWDVCMSTSAFFKNMSNVDVDCLGEIAHEESPLPATIWYPRGLPYPIQGLRSFSSLHHSIE